MTAPMPGMGPLSAALSAQGASYQMSAAVSNLAFTLAPSGVPSVLGLNLVTALLTSEMTAEQVLRVPLWLLQEATRLLVEMPWGPAGMARMVAIAVEREVPDYAFSRLVTACQSPDEAVQVLDAAGGVDLLDAVALKASGLPIDLLAWAGRHLADWSLPSEGQMRLMHACASTEEMCLVLTLYAEHKFPVPAAIATAAALPAGHDTAARFVLDGMDPVEAVRSAWLLAAPNRKVSPGRPAGTSSGPITRA